MVKKHLAVLFSVLLFSCGGCSDDGLEIKARVTHDVNVQHNIKLDTGREPGPIQQKRKLQREAREREQQNKLERNLWD